MEQKCVIIQMGRGLKFENHIWNIIWTEILRNSELFLGTYFTARICHQGAYASPVLQQETPGMSFMIPVTVYLPDSRRLQPRHYEKDFFLNVL